METAVDMSEALVLDGNAAAGLLQEIFAEEMTASPAQCAGCGRVGALGRLLAYMSATGIVLRCPDCGNIVLRMVVTPREIFIDARGAMVLRLDRKQA